MALTLGIHLGHHSSCAVIHNGAVLAGIQQERITRKKHDGFDILTNSLPINECLEACQISLKDIDFIVSSFQAISPGGCGLHQPLIAPDFNLFDPFDKRHFVISHHLAHAYSAYGLSNYSDSAVLVADLAGSSTIDGADIQVPFDVWYSGLSLPTAQSVKTEILSLYSAHSGKLRLLEREFAIAHNAPESLVQSVASLYDNVSEFIFKTPNAHGQLMALAAYADKTQQVQGIPRPEDLFLIASDGKVCFKNDWQNQLPWNLKPMELAGLAASTQVATEMILLHYAKRAKALTDLSHLVAAGGVFLNIPANSRINSADIFDFYFVPSSPHDAGIAIGCGYYGDMVLNGMPPNRVPISSDRHGRQYGDLQISKAIAEYKDSLAIQPADVKLIADDLFSGKIVARFFGRSEFGPRALGGRSLLASPISELTKDKLNRIKGRQKWRPVAPIVQKSALPDFFHGPPSSPYMNFLHYVREEFVDHLQALNHPDGSTRAQTLEPDDDPDLHLLLEEFAKLSGYPMLVNTSLNGPGQPILETPNEAISFFLDHKEIDGLILGNNYLCRQDRKIDEQSYYSLSVGTIVHCVQLAETRQFLASKNKRSFLIPDVIATPLLTESGISLQQLDSDLHDTVKELIANELLEAKKL